MNNKKGISLIILLVTIIVMIILAGVIILNLSDDDTMSDASKAVSLTNERQAQQIADLKWAHAYNEGYRTQEELAAVLGPVLEQQGITDENYKITITTEGIKVKAKSNMWEKKDFTVVRGNDVLQIGDTINYTATGTNYSGGWKVLGADEDGNLLIMSAADIGELTLGSNSSKPEAQEDWLTAVEQLDAKCEPYGKGSGALSVRSITAEDVNAVTGYTPKKR